MKTKIVQCRVIRYGEFPDLLFGKSQEDEFFYFNATHYIQKKGNLHQHNVRDFQVGFHYWITAAKAVYEIEQEDLIICDETTGEILIDECLALPFLAYIDQGFAMYIIERMSEMLLNGIVASDTWLLHNSRLRFKEPNELTNIEQEHEK